MAIGVADRQTRFDDAALLLGERLSAGSVYRLLAEDGHRLFGDDYFADVFTRSRLGRPTVAARTIATVMLLQALEGLSDREACDRLAFDLRWKAAAGLPVGSGSDAGLPVAYWSPCVGSCPAVCCVGVGFAGPHQLPVRVD